MKAPRRAADVIGRKRSASRRISWRRARRPCADRGPASVNCCAVAREDGLLVARAEVGGRPGRACGCERLGVSAAALQRIGQPGKAVAGRRLLAGEEGEDRRRHSRRGASPFRPSGAASSPRASRDWRSGSAHNRRSCSRCSGAAAASRSAHSRRYSRRSPKHRTGRGAE